MTRLVLALATLAGCSIAPIDYTGKQCPCPTGYTCNLATQTCTKDETMIDAPLRDSDSMDALAIDSCLPNPRTKLVYASPGFSDFPAGWIQNSMGSWSMNGMGTGVQQTTSSLNTAWLSHDIPTTNGDANYRVVVTMRSLDLTGDGIGIAFRVGSLTQGTMYACALDTTFDELGLYYVNQQMPGALKKRQVTGISDPAALFTMEINVTGATLSCCIRDHDSQLSVPSSMLMSGGAGPVTLAGQGSFLSMYAYE